MPPLGVPQTIARALLGRQLAGRDHPPAPAGVDGHRLFHEHVLARRDGGGQVVGAEHRRGGHNHVVQVALDQLAVGVEAAEDLVVGDHAAVLELVLESFRRPLGLVGEGVGAGHDGHGRVGRHGVVDRVGASPAAADQADLDAVRAACRHLVRRLVARRIVSHCLVSFCVRFAGCVSSTGAGRLDQGRLARLGDGVHRLGPELRSAGTRSSLELFRTQEVWISRPV